LVLVDYYSSFIEVDRLSSTTSAEVIKVMKKHFARYGVPDILIPDQGPQCTSAEFKEFAELWGFKHSMCSPGHHQSNGKAECSESCEENNNKKKAKESQRSMGSVVGIAQHSNRRDAVKPSPENDE
jgi:transposase InsO family protein